MIRADLAREIQALPFQEQFEMLEYLARSLRQQSQAHPASRVAPRSLAAGAAALRADYQNDSDLTAFTALDGEEASPPGSSHPSDARRGPRLRQEGKTGIIPNPDSI